MATDKPRFTITLPDEVYEEVSEYKEENGYIKLSALASLAAS